MFEPKHKTGAKAPAEYAVLACLTFVLGYAAIRQGGYDLLDWNVSLLVLGLCSLAFAFFSDLTPSAGRWIFWTSLLFPAYVAFQWVPLPYAFLKIASPARAQILDRLGHIMQPAAFAALSVSRETTFAYLFRIVGYALVFFVVRAVASRAWQRRSWSPLFPLLGIAALEAVFGLFQNASGADVQGTYTNKNHFAGLLEMTLPFGVGYAAALADSGRSRTGLSLARVLKAGAAAAVAVVILMGLRYSLSKTGFVAGLFGLLVGGLVAMGTRFKGWKGWLAGCGLAAIFLLAIVFFPPDDLVNSYGQLFSADAAAGEGRVPIWRDSIHLIADYPLFGSGLGTYGNAFVKYQTAVVDQNFAFAHNDYLELAAELGGVGVLIVGGLMLAVVFMAFRGAIRGPDRNVRYVGAACAGAMAAIGLHSLTDFNTYVPANAMVLAWISGIAASLPARKPESVRSVPNQAGLRAAILAFGCLLTVYALGWILFEQSYRDNLGTEALFCRFGICDSGAVLDTLTRQHNGNLVAAPPAELAEMLRRDPLSPDRWCDLGTSLAGTGRYQQAKYCFDTGVTLGSNVPPLLLRAAEFYYAIQEPRLALEQTSHAMEKTNTYDDLVFQWYRAKNVMVSDVLSHGLPGDRRSSQAFLRYLVVAGNPDDAATAWNWLLSRGFADDKLAREYVAPLWQAQQYDKAAHSWAAYLGNRQNDFLKSEWLYNGDFEFEPAGAALDWRIDSPAGARVTVDPAVAHTGSHSLRIQFDGKENVAFSHASITAFVEPGEYHFEAYVRTQDLTTDQGVGFRILDPEGTSHLDIKTEKLTGTNPWKKIEETIRVPREARLLMVQVIREHSWKFDNLIAGTAWIDGVKLVKWNEGDRLDREVKIVAR